MNRRHPASTTSVARREESLGDLSAYREPVEKLFSRHVQRSLVCGAAEKSMPRPRNRQRWEDEFPQAD